MKAKSYGVVFSGKLAQQLGHETIVSNLILELGISDTKARTLLERPGVLLKRFDNQADAQRLLDRLERAGVLGRLQHAQPTPGPVTTSNSESSLFRILGNRPAPAGNQSVLLRQHKG